MKKYLIGAIVGFMLSLGVGAHAEVVNMIGQVIDGAFNVKVNGVQLANQAIVVQGTSYLPVREFGEATGYTVGFDADLGITMTKQVATPSPSPTPSEQPTPSPSSQPGTSDNSLIDTTLPKDKQIAYLKDEIDITKTVIVGIKMSLANQGGGDFKEGVKEEIEKRLADSEKRLADLQSLLDNLQK